MKVILAQPRGFCAGVNRAIAVVEKALEKYGAPVYVRHEIVHNKTVVDELKAKGAIFVEDVDDVPPGAVLIFSAHGVSRDVETRAKDKGRVIIDATCPLVMKVHREVVLMHEKGLLVIMVGHKGHAEVEGTMGQIEGGIVCVSSVEEVRKLSFPASVKTGFVTQTTLSIDETQEIVTELRRRFPGIESMGEADICYATHSRQAAVRDLAGKADLFLVIGSKTSSNSNRLRDLAAQTCEEAYLIDSCADIDLAWLEGKATVAVTAGASAPEHLVQETVDFLKRHGANSVLTMPGVPDTIHFPLPTMI